MRRTRFVTGVTAAAVLAWAAPTGAAGEAKAVSGPTAKYYGYLTPVVVIAKGGPITYTNLDIERHNVVQDVSSDGVHSSGKQKWCPLFDRGRCPIFYSALIGLGKSESVKGLKFVKPGKVYTFYCTLHPGMKGKLVVQP
jgi:plastocyanin